jgi:hypothetical protein
LHILNCICVYQVNKNISCYDEDNYIEIPATRLTADSWSNILTDVYNRPSPMKPYYYIHNINKQVDLPTNLYNNTDNTGTDSYRNSYPNQNSPTENTEFPRTITLKINNTDSSISLVEKKEGIRVSNPTQVRCEIRYGKDNTVYELK